MMELKLYEVSMGRDLWWIAAEDELEASELFRHDLYDSEFSDEEIDEAMSDFEITEMEESQAALITLESRGRNTVYSLWELFKHIEENVNLAGIVHKSIYDDDD